VQLLNPYIQICIKYEIKKLFTILILCTQSQDEDSQMVTEVDLFISTKAVKVLNADTQVSDPKSLLLMNI